MPNAVTSEAWSGSARMLAATGPAFTSAAAHTDPISSQPRFGVTSCQLAGGPGSVRSWRRQATQATPNSGEMVTIGPLGIDPTDDNSRIYTTFDIETLPDGTNLGFASLTTDGLKSRLYSIDLATGAATLIGTINIGDTIRGIALQ